MCTPIVYQLGMIYLIATDDRQFCKIGRSADPAKRLAALQTAWPHPLALIATRDENDSFERELHRSLAKWHLRGEWFRFNDRVLKHFNEQMAGEPHKLKPPIFSSDEVERLFGDIANPISRTIAMVRMALSEGETPAALARRAGLHRNALYGAQEPGWNPKASTLEQLWPFLED